jgi:hypothetical protein
MRKALYIGIDYYLHMKRLSGCVNDAHKLKSILETHADHTGNFVKPRILVASGPAKIVERGELKDAARELFADDSDIALLYFAGHGFIEDTGGFLCASDCKTGDDGFSIAELMTLAKKSKARSRIIILDSCYSGIAGDQSTVQGVAEIKEGMTIMTASTAEQPAREVTGGGAGVFTSLFMDALGGAAANLVGHVTPGSVYAHIDQSLGPWGQRPVFKTNVKRFVSLRKANPPIPLEELLALSTYFPQPGYAFQLDPSYEPERSEEQRRDPKISPPDPKNNAVFAVLQRYAKVNLVRPVGAPHMWHAAMQSKSCELTVVGEHYRELVANGLISHGA